MPLLQNLTGRRFGRLLVVKRGRRHHKATYWVVRCDCGTVKEARADHLLKGRTVSCMCARRTQQGLAGGRTYRSWAAMLERCLNPACNHFQYYGGRGITVASAWLEFKNFYADMGERPPKTTLGRRDNDGPYNGLNCRWETDKQQRRNRQDTVWVTWEGQRRRLIDVCEELNFPAHIARIRFKTLKWSLEDALSKPIRGKKARRPSIAHKTEPPTAGEDNPRRPIDLSTLGVL